jgi:hypothetical protein
VVRQARGVGELSEVSDRSPNPRQRLSARGDCIKPIRLSTSTPAWWGGLVQQEIPPLSPDSPIPTQRPTAPEGATQIESLLATHNHSNRSKGTGPRSHRKNWLPVCYGRGHIYANRLGGLCNCCTTLPESTSLRIHVLEDYARPVPIQETHPQLASSPHGLRPPSLLSSPPLAILSALGERNIDYRQKSTNMWSV